MSISKIRLTLFESSFVFKKIVCRQLSYFPYSSNSTFLKVPTKEAKPEAPFSIAGIPFDGACTNRSGTRFGPKGIRDASHMLCDGIHPYFDISPVESLNDSGDLFLPNTSLNSMRGELENLVKPLIQKYHMLWLGGDHSITLSLLRAYASIKGKPLAVIHFDAHNDAWKDHFGEPSGHGTWVYEAYEEKLIIPECFFQIGIRSPGPRDARQFVSDRGGIIFTAKSLRGLESSEQLSPMLSDIRARLALHGNPDVYLTLDIDCLDPAFAPGTGTPEVGGLSVNQVQTILEELTPELNFVGMDCVEVSPPYDHVQITSHAASNFVWTYLCGRMIFNGRQI